MARKNIGILLLGDTNWVGGLYYVLNIIRSLNSLKDEEKPQLVVFYGNETAKAHLDQLDYPYLQKVAYQGKLVSKYWNRSKSLVSGNDSGTAKLCEKYNLTALYPYNYPFSVPTKTKIIAWFPDFQHKKLPHFFGEKELEQRDKYLQEIQDKIPYLVLSSKDAASHYQTYYPQSKIQVEVLPFVSSIDEGELPPIEKVMRKHALSGSYFMVANQFWEHKNHWVVLKALKKLKDNGHEPLFVFTGKEDDHRNPNYFNDLKHYVKENGLQKNVRFLGFIDRSDQLCLLKHARSVVQPSKFEGWGTVVEDAKTLNQQVIASNIPVHHEQLGKNAYYFDLEDSDQLMSLVLKVENGELEAIHHYSSLEDRKLEFAKRFMEIALG